MRSRITRAEASDGDWMETAWVLRHEHPDIFEQVIILLRDRMQRFAEQAAAAIQNPVAESSEPGEVEESAI